MKIMNETDIYVWTTKVITILIRWSRWNVYKFATKWQGISQTHMLKFEQNIVRCLKLVDPLILKIYKLDLMLIQSFIFDFFQLFWDFQLNATISLSRLI